MRKLICVLLAAVFLWLAMGVAAAGPAVAFDRRANERALLQLINHARTRRGLARLRLNAPLDRAALSHSRSMLAHGYFSHSSLGGGSYCGRLVHAGYRRKGCTSWMVGEVIGWGAGARGTPRAVFTAWMHSRAHRSILLGRRWRDVGVGAASGTFRGLSGAVLFTVDQGRRTR
jgi:uncharacterized protein YkwD